MFQKIKQNLFVSHYSDVSIDCSCFLVEGQLICDVLTRRNINQWFPSDPISAIRFQCQRFLHLPAHFQYPLLLEFFEELFEEWEFTHVCSTILF